MTTFKLEPPAEILPKIEKRLYTKPPTNRQKDKYSIVALYNFLSIDNTFGKKPESTGKLKDFTLEKIDAKTYPQVMDSYSLHYFIIRKGRVLEETPEF